MRLAHTTLLLADSTPNVSMDANFQPTPVELYVRMAKRSSMPALGTTTSSSSTSSVTSTSKSLSGASSISGTNNSTSSSKASMARITSLDSSSISSSSGAMPAIATTSASTTSTSYTFQASIPTEESKNPYISRQTLPSNSVFIVVAAVLGALAVGVLSTWLIVWWNSRRRAKNEKEVQYYNPFQYESGGNGSASHLLSGSSQSSFMEKSSGSVNSKFSDPVSLSFDTTTPGRAYREMSNNMSRRGSMTISPVLEMMRSSASNLELPLFSSSPDLPQLSSQVQQEAIEPRTKKSRPPSQVLDDMLTAIEFSSDYPDGKSWE